jgi:hypothetical protein
MEIGALVDVAQLILLLAVAYILFCIVRMLRQVQAIGRFWLQRWWGATYGEEAVWDRPVSDDLVSPPPVHSSGP